MDYTAALEVKDIELKSVEEDLNIKDEKIEQLTKNLDMLEQITSCLSKEKEQNEKTRKKQKEKIDKLQILISKRSINKIRISEILAELHTLTSI